MDERARWAGRGLVQQRFPSIVFLADAHPELRPVFNDAAVGGKVTRRQLGDAIAAATGGPAPFYYGDPDAIL